MTIRALLHGFPGDETFTADYSLDSKKATNVITVNALLFYPSKESMGEVHRKRLFLQYELSHYDGTVHHYEWAQIKIT